MFQQTPFIVHNGVGRIELEDSDEMFAPTGSTEWHRSGRHTTINGMQLPVITMVPGEMQRWRMIHSGFREMLKLQIERDPSAGAGGPDHLVLNQVAVDGLPLRQIESLTELELFRATGLTCWCRLHREGPST